MERQKYLKKCKERRQKIVSYRDKGWTWQKIANRFRSSIPAVMAAYKREKQ